MPHPIEQGEWRFRLLGEDRKKEAWDRVQFRDGILTRNGARWGTYTVADDAITVQLDPGEAAAADLPEDDDILGPPIAGRSTITIAAAEAAGIRARADIVTVYDDPELEPFVEPGDLERG